MLVDSYGNPLPPSVRPAAAQSGGSGPKGSSPWFATQQSPNRKQLFNFQADPAYQLSPSARQSMDVSAQTLAANFGPAGSLKILARTIGYLSPQARTGDSAYDSEMEAAFQRVAGSPVIFDAAGADTFYSYQVWTTMERFIRGELFSLFTETTSGAARIASRGAHTVGGVPAGTRPEDLWHDGIRSDVNGFPLSYHFYGRNGKGSVVNAPAVFHHRNRHALGARRGVTGLAHALNDQIDSLETLAAWKAGIKNAAGVAITRKQDAAHGTAPSSIGLNGPVGVDLFAPPDAAGVPAENGPAIPLSFEQYMQDGLFSQVPLDVLHDDRPHPNAMTFLDNLKRNLAIGVGVAPQLLFFMDDPGGAWSRILLDCMVKFIGDQYLNHLRPFCQRFWVYAISKEIKAGRLAPPPRGMTPQSMWNVRWCPPRSLTADLGRMGRLSIEMRRAAMTTFAAHFEELGLDWEDELRQGAKEIAFCRQLEKEEGLQPGDMTGWAGLPAPSASGPAALMERVEEMMARMEELAENRPSS